MNWKKGLRNTSPTKTASPTPSIITTIHENTDVSVNNTEVKMLNEVASLNTLSIRFNKFKVILESPNIDLDALKNQSWSGIPDELRSTIWKLLMGYLPVNSDRRESTLLRKRKEYEEFVGQIEIGKDQALYHQIEIDVKRSNADVALYQRSSVQESLCRILYCWAIRHPASGYVQGINDLVVPFYQVFWESLVVDRIISTPLSLYCFFLDEQVDVPTETMFKVESDSFWCLTKLLDGIQDNYTFSQPGIQRQIARLKDLVHRIDGNIIGKPQFLF